MGESPIITYITGLSLTILSALTGHNYYQISRIRERIPESYRAKDECNRICDSFKDSIDNLSEKVDKGFEKLYDKMSEKENK